MMDASVLANDIMAELVKRNFKSIDLNRVICEAVAVAVVAHIKTNAVVTTPVTSGSSAGSYEGTVK